MPQGSTRRRRHTAAQRATWKPRGNKSRGRSGRCTPRIAGPAARATMHPRNSSASAFPRHPRALRNALLDTAPEALAHLRSRSHAISVSPRMPKTRLGGGSGGLGAVVPSRALPRARRRREPRGSAELPRRALGPHAPHAEEPGLAHGLRNGTFKNPASHTACATALLRTRPRTRPAQRHS